MTMTEERKIRFQIARMERTNPCNVHIEREERKQDEHKVYATVKGYKIGAQLLNGNITLLWRVI